MSRPNLIYLKNFILTLLGIAFGVLVSYLGISSSLLAVPAIAVLLGFRFAKASASTTAIVLFASVASLLSYNQKLDINVPAAVVIVVGQIVGASLAVTIKGSVSIAARLNSLVGVFLAGLGVLMIYESGHGWSWSHIYSDAYGSGIGGQMEALAAMCGLGFLVGFLSRLFAVSGLLVVPALELIARVWPLEAQGTALLVLALGALPTSVVQLQKSEMDQTTTKWLAGGAVFGGLLGAMWATSNHSPMQMMSFYGIALVALGSIKILQLGRSKLTPTSA